MNPIYLKMIEKMKNHLDSLSDKEFQKELQSFGFDCEREFQTLYPLADFGSDSDFFVVENSEDSCLIEAA